MSDYSLITHTLPETIAVGGKSYTIDTRTCKALQCFLASEDEETPMEVRMAYVLEQMVFQFNQLPPERYMEAYGEIVGYLNGFPTARKASKAKSQILSYSQDHALIVSAFRQAYGIGLAEIKRMHWWEFLALLGGIPEGTRLGEVMKVRTMPINPKDSAEVRQAKIKAKNAVAIEPKRRKSQSGYDVISMALENE